MRSCCVRLRSTVDDRSIGTATLRAVHVSTGPVGGLAPEETLIKTSATPLADLMAVTTVHEQGSDCLSQSMVLNATGVVQGSVAAAGTELVAASAVAEKAGDLNFRTGSLRVNYLRPFLAGPASRYVATAIHTGGDGYGGGCASAGGQWLAGAPRACHRLPSQSQLGRPGTAVPLNTSVHEMRSAIR
jgi:hypothetical protein